MSHLLSPALAAVAIGVSGCTYFPVPADPIRILTTAAEVSTCRRLGSVGLARTDGEAPFSFADLTVAVPGYGPSAGSSAGREIVGPNFAVRLNVMRDNALARGATDLLLTRRIYNDWSYVEGSAYLCRQ